MVVNDDVSDGGAERFSPLAQRNILADEVYTVLRESLLAQRIAPGARINLDRLAKELHVSNTPVRQALARLEAEGLVTKEPFRGFAASPLLDLRTVQELYQFRLLLEPPSAAQAARSSSPQTTTALLRLCQAAEAIPLTGPDSSADALGRYDVEFHSTLGASTGNRIIADATEQSLLRMSRYTLYTHAGARSHARDEAWAEHRAIVEAIAEGNDQRAAQAMRSHLRNGLARMERAVQ